MKPAARTLRVINYLAYGSNLLPRRLCARIPAARVLGTAALDGWALAFNKRGRDGSAKCNLRAAAGARAWGAIYAITAADKRILDDIEGAGRGYDIDRLELPGFGPCYFYRAAADAIDDCLRPYDWYRALVVAGARHHAFPQDYVAAIAAIDAQPDPDRARAALHLRLLD